MRPIEWIDLALTPRRYAPARFRVLAARLTAILTVETTRPARLVQRLTAPCRRARSRLLTGRPGWQRVAWWVRRSIWASIWSLVVAYRLRPKEVPTPSAEEPIDLIGAPESYPDFRAQHLVVPSDVPRAEMSLLGDNLVQFIHLLQDVYPINASHQPAAAWEPQHRLRQVYPPAYRMVRMPPVWHPELAAAADAGNLLGALAVGGPFAKFLERSEPTGGYRIDLDHLAAYPVRDGLAPLGCTIHYEARDAELWVTAIDYQGGTYRPDHPGWGFAERVALCSLVTHSTVWRHGMQYHVAGLAPVAVATHNLDPAHPLRRLLAAHVAETISTNYHTHLTLRRSGFDVTGLSFTYETILRYYDDGALYFDLRRLDIPADLERRAIPDDLHYPYGTQALTYWGTIEAYVRDYVDHYYPDNATLAADDEVARWVAALDRHFTRGVGDYLSDPTRENLIRFCTLFIYAVSVEHEENTLWDYTVFLPTNVPADGGPQSVGDVQLAMNFQLLISSATNRLINDFSHLALDPAAARIMNGFRAQLRALEDQMRSGPDHYWRVHPSSLEAGVSA